MSARFPKRCFERSARRRQGTTLLELAVAVAILTALLTTCVQLLRVVSEQQRAADRRALALQSVQAIAEELGNFPFDEISTQSASQVAIPPAAARSLPGARLVVTVAEESEPRAKRATVELSWTDRGRSAGPIRLTVWNYQSLAVAP